MIPAPAPGMVRSFLMVVFGPTKVWVVQVAEHGEGSAVLHRSTHSNLGHVMADGAARGWDVPRTLMYVAGQVVAETELNLAPACIDTTIQVSADDGVVMMLAVFQAVYQLTHGGRLPDMFTTATALEEDGQTRVVDQGNTVRPPFPSGPIGEG